jgi:hypothetical protein
MHDRFHREGDRRRDERARCFPEILSLLRGVVAAFASEDGPEISAARSWLKGHCPGCGCTVDKNRACRGCKATWREQNGARVRA